MTEAAPIELPAGRRSYISPTPAPNIYDKDWIPVLGAADLKKVTQFAEKEVSPYHTASFSPFPKPSRPPVTRPPLVHNYSKSSLAPESVTSELEGEPLPPRSSSKKPPIGSAITTDPASQHLRQTSADAPSSDGQETVTSDGADAPSTAGTASLIEEQYYTLPDAPVAKEDILPPAVGLSASSSIASNRTKTSILPPTSKYNNRKPVSSLPSGRPPTIKSQPTTPVDSPRQFPSTVTAPPPIPQSEPLPSSQFAPSELSQTTPPATPKVYVSKSTASERRLRALHSHPSHPSLHTQVRSRANSSSPDAETTPKPPSMPYRPRKSTDTRTASSHGTIYDSQMPKPAPTTPLPQLPPEASPPMRDGLGIRQAQIAAPTPPHASPQLLQQPQEAHLASVKPSHHTEMASFMTSTNTVIFRRFDDVHVKLLLCLQDEISQMERELAKLDSGVPVTGDKTAQRIEIMIELRRVVAEYDHLFANWSQMQGNKASKQTVQDLKQWLEKPDTAAGASGGAKDDLLWLESQKDLSSVRLDGANEKASLKAPSQKKGGGGGGFASLFGCGGKRK